MLTIAAISPVPSLGDVPAKSSGGDAGFAPVLDALLTPADPAATPALLAPRSIPTVTDAAAAALPDMPELAAPPIDRQTGDDLPLTGTPSPLATAPNATPPRRVDSSSPQPNGETGPDETAPPVAPPGGRPGVTDRGDRFTSPVSRPVSPRTEVTTDLRRGRFTPPTAFADGQPSATPPRALAGQSINELPDERLDPDVSRDVAERLGAQPANPVASALPIMAPAVPSVTPAPASVERGLDVASPAKSDAPTDRPAAPDHARPRDRRTAFETATPPASDITPAFTPAAMNADTASAPTRAGAGEGQTPPATTPTPDLASSARLRQQEAPLPQITRLESATALPLRREGAAEPASGALRSLQASPPIARGPAALPPSVAAATTLPLLATATAPPAPALPPAMDPILASAAPAPLAAPADTTRATASLPGDPPAAMTRSPGPMLIASTPPPTDAPPARGPSVAVAPASATAPPAPAILPAFQAFGAALHRAAAAERRPVARAPIDFLSPAPALAASPAIAPITDPSPLDTTQPRWPDQMIARIEGLRDLANEADTRIRLHPDALGHIDVALRRENEGVRVHFTAAEPATAKLLADAHPRLTELAEAKGLKLGGAPVDAGASGGGDRRQPATPQPALPARPVRARAASDAQSDPRPDTDDRLA